MTASAAQMAIDQVDDILEAFYVDELSFENSEEEDIAFYDLYEDDEQSLLSRGSSSPAFDDAGLNEPCAEDLAVDDDENDSSSTVTKQTVNGKAGGEREEVKLENKDLAMEVKPANSNEADEAIES